MLFKKKYKLISVPTELREKLDEAKLFNKHLKESNNIKYSLSPSEQTIAEVQASIKKNATKQTFLQLLFKYLNNSDEKNSTIYKKAHIDRRTFSKIYSGKDKYPGRIIIIKLGLALKLNYLELSELLHSRYYSLSSDEWDVVITYCVKYQIYDYDTINDLLYTCNLPTLDEKKY